MERGRAEGEGGAGGEEREEESRTGRNGHPTGPTPLENKFLDKILIEMTERGREGPVERSGGRGQGEGEGP